MQLFEPATEHERVAALEPDHPLSGLCAFDEQRIDLVLGQRVRVRCLARIDDLDCRVELVEQRLGQPVDDDDVGFGQELASA